MFRWGAEPVTRQLSCGTATVVKGRDVSIPYFRERGITYVTETFVTVTAQNKRYLQWVCASYQVFTFAPCVVFLIIPRRQMIGPGFTQRRSTTAVSSSNINSRTCIMALFHCMVRHGTVHFWGVFHWVLYLVPGTFLVPPQPRFQWRFSTAWYGTVRHGSVRYGTAQFGSVCVSTAV